MALTQLKTSGIADDAVTTDKLANAINTERTANTAKVSLDADSVTGAKIADDAVGAEHIEQLDADLQFIDGEGLLLGTGDDAALKFNGTDTLLTTAGKIKLYPDGNLEILDNSSGEYRAKFIDNGAVELYYDNTKKFETSSSGAAFSVGTGEVDINSTGSGTQHSLRLLNSDASADNKIGMYFGPANNIAGAYINAHAEADFSSTANRQCGLEFGVRNGANFSEAMSINKDGIVTKPYQPSFAAYSTGSWTHGSDTGTLNIDTITTEAFDVGGNYNHSTGVFTAPVAGKYFFSFTYSYICTSGYLNIYLKKGVSGTYSSYARMQSSPPQQSSNYSDASGISGIIDLAAQNTVRPQAELNYAGNQIWNINFSGYLIG